MTLSSPSYFNPRAPCGARQVFPVTSGEFQKFQSTRPVRGATSLDINELVRAVFQSTRPVRGATAKYDGELILDTISIHAPRAGRDHVVGNLLHLR